MGFALSVLFVLGAAMGSFAGAMAWRIKTRRNVTSDRSECERCHHKLGAADLIPVMSWLMLKGRCRYCKKPIGYSAFILEVVLGTVFALSLLAWPYSLSDALGWTYFISWLVALVLLAILFVYDMRHFLLPNVLMYPLIGVGVVLFVCRQLTLGTDYAAWPLEFGLGLIPVTGVYWLLYTMSSGKWVGYGDVKLGIFIGLVLGWQGALLTLMLSNLLGVIWVLPGLLLGRLKRSDAVPFGPFLIAATVIAVLYGPGIISAYTQLFLL